MSINPYKKQIRLWSTWCLYNCAQVVNILKQSSHWGFPFCTSVGITKGVPSNSVILYGLKALMLLLLISVDFTSTNISSYWASIPKIVCVFCNTYQDYCLICVVCPAWFQVKDYERNFPLPESSQSSKNFIEILQVSERGNDR